MIMDNSAHPHHQLVQMFPPVRSPQRADINVSTTPPHTPSPTTNNSAETLLAPTTTVSSSKTGLKRSFDVAFLMMPDERIKQKQLEKQVCLGESLERRHYPTDLSPRQLMHPQLVHSLHEQLPEHFSPLQEARRYPQITLRAPRIYDDPSVVIPDTTAAPIKSAFTKVVNARQESPVPPPPSLSPDQLSGSSMSPPIVTPPPRTNSGNDSLSNGSSGNTASVAPPSPQTQPSIVYQNFRPEYDFNGAFHSVSQVQALQAAAVQNHRIRHQLLYRPTLIGASAANVNVNSGAGGAEFLPAYPAFPFAPGTASAAQHFAPITTSELPRIPLQSPAAAAILSTLIPPTLASTFTLTAQNVCAKCNISFRMTSDLVYHMRSHHKSEVACDPNRRKREEKLKCPVCNESFRERHHLTRHMTAHQDKESDAATVPTTTAPSANSEGSIHVGGGHTRLHARSTASLSK